MKEWSIRLCLMVFGLLISAVALEFYLSEFAPNPRTWPKGYYEHDKYIGWKGIPGVEKKIVKGRIVSYLKMNSHGFRDRERTWEKKEGVFRILVLGDSFTEGAQVLLEQTFPYILEEKLNSGGSKRFEVINLGMAGFGTGNEYLTLKHYGLKYQPDFVILEFTIVNDVSDNSSVLRKNPYSPYFVLNNGKLEELPFKLPNKDEEETNRDVTGRFRILKYLLVKFFPNIYYSVRDINGTPLQILKNILRYPLTRFFPNTYHSLYDKIKETPWLANFLRKHSIMEFKEEIEIPQYFGIYVREYPPEMQNAWDVTKSLILKLKDDLEMNKIGFLVVTIPSDFECLPERDKIQENPQMRALIDLKKPETILSNFLQAHNINYLQLRPGFEKYTAEAGKRLYFPYAYDQHFNAVGHAVAAELIYRKLRDDKLIPMRIP